MRRLLPVLVLTALALSLGQAGAARADQRRPTITVSISVGSTLATAGTTRYSGTATGVPTGVPVYLEYRGTDHRWYTEAVTSTRTHGAFDDTFASDMTGRTTFRAHLHASKQNADAVSAVRTVTMSRIFYLSDVRPMSITSINTRPVTLGVNTYPHAITFIANATSLERSTEVWDLRGRCSLFTSQIAYANPKQASAAARGDADARVDGTIATTAAIQPNDAGSRLSAPIQDARSLQLTVTFEGKDETSRIAWLDPRILCSADPAR